LQELSRLARRPALGELLERAAAGATDRMTLADARGAVGAERPA